VRLRVVCFLGFVFVKGAVLGFVCLGFEVIFGDLQHIFWWFLRCFLIVEF